jgi:MFS family permease
MFPLVALPTRFRSLPIARQVALITLFAQMVFYLPALTPYLLARGLNLTQIAGLQSILIWTMLVLEVPTGVLADRLGHHWGQRLALVCLVAGEAGFLFARDYPAFMLVQVVTGAGIAFASGSVDALVYESLPQPPTDRTEAMQRAKGQIGVAYNLGSLFAFFVGGVLVADLSLDRITLAMALSVAAISIACAGSFLVIAPREQTSTAVSRGSLALVRDGVALLRQSPQLRRVVLASLLTSAFGAHLLVLYGAYFLESGVPGGWFGPALGIGATLAMVGQRFSYRIVGVLGARRGVLLATGVLYLLMALTTHPVAAVTLFSVQWGMIQVSGPLFAGYLNEHIPSESGGRATALSLISLLASIYGGLGGIAIGALADASLSLAFAAIGIVVLIGSVTLRIEDRPLVVAS